MKNYKVKIKANNPEYKLSDAIENGVDADGVMCITFRNGEAQSMTFSGITIMQMAEAIADEEKQFGSILRQAAAIANGIMEAKRIHEEDKKRSMASDFAKAFARME